VVCGVPVVKENGQRRGSVLTSEADSFARYARKWTLKLAKAVGTRFIDAAALYRKNASLDTFADTTYDGR
jgi:hypothetical protein